LKTGTKWLVGCGISLGVVVLLVLVLVVGGIGYFRGVISDLEESGQSQTVLDAQLGAMSDYTPPLDGAVPPDRLGLFLTVREQLQPWHDTMTGHLSDFPPADEGPATLGPMQQLGVVTGMGGFFDDLGDYLRQRNETLLEHEMGLGEYFYIHTLVYHWWLGHNPIDGPETLYGLEHEGGVNIQFFDDGSNFGKTGSLQRYHVTVQRMLERQLAAVDAAPEGVPDGWRDALAAEVAAPESDIKRVPWDGSLPPRLTAELEQHRVRLEETYCPVTNVFDMHDAGGVER
jgi:hypothetical protein